MNEDPHRDAPPRPPPKSVGGMRRIVAATRYSLAGLKAAWRNEAAFRQELAIGVPLIVAAPWIAPDFSRALVLIAAVLFVFIVELLNSGIEALADAVSLEHRELLGRAKDFGSAAVMIAIALAACVWLAVLL